MHVGKFQSTPLGHECSCIIEFIIQVGESNKIMCGLLSILLLFSQRV